MIPKFRALNIKTGFWFDEQELVFCDGKWFQDWPSFEDDFPLDMRDCVVMQSTGMKDKNGVEIFEGDVVAVENHPFQRKEDSGIGMEIEGNYVVGWNQHDLTWCAGDLLLARLKPYVKVIGNIYENSELLERSGTNDHS
ncbi:YopX family protein [Enterococcus hirae]